MIVYKPRISRKAQSGTAILLIVLAFLILFYMLWLPPEERVRLLGEDVSTGPGVGHSVSGSVIFEEKIGRLDYLETDEITHSVPVFTIATRTDAVALKESPSIYIYNNAFSEESKTLTFGAIPDNTEHVLLSFVVKEGKGRLSIFFNDQLITEGMFTGSPDPIVLPSEYLEHENRLDFEVSGVGGEFWSTNKYLLEHVLVSADVTDRSNDFAQQNFVLSEPEYENLERIVVRFLPDCIEEEVSRIHVDINGKEIYTGLPDCGGLNTIEVDKSSVREGDNTVGFLSEKGSYKVEQLQITSKLNEPIPPVYYFTMLPNVLEQLAFDQRDLFLVMTFVDDLDWKRGTITLNGHSTTFNTKEGSHTWRINGVVKSGTNSLKIQPQVAGLDIATLQIIIG